jgi:hypothetical protein
MASLFMFLIKFHTRFTRSSCTSLYPLRRSERLIDPSIPAPTSVIPSATRVFAKPADEGVSGFVGAMRINKHHVTRERFHIVSEEGDTTAGTLT